ncbi:hypothetical protein [Burkholderia ubonensis]|uniref:hypothetical protein n=1 Tax=Burkholderia ubonensis TaxID=101571 RepID=UPI000AB42C6E|nr:hypothetical protein [Burkholderia ubonensis]
MIKVSLFTEQKRETRLDKIGDAPNKLGEHVDFPMRSTRPRPGRAESAQNRPKALKA